MALLVLLSLQSSFAGIVSPPPEAQELTAQDVLTVSMKVDSDDHGIVDALDNCPGVYIPD